MLTKKAVELYLENNIIHIEKPKPFHEYFSTIYSQWGEDGILEEIFNRIKIKNKFFVEFGAGDGFKISNTAHLRINQGWSGLLMEGNADLIPLGSEDINLHQEMVFAYNVNQLFEKYNVPSTFGLLSIDVDGDDAYIFDALDTKIFSPDVIIAEYNPGLPNHRGIKIKEQKENLSNGNFHQRGYVGANLCELYNIAKLKGYEFVTTISVNVIFIKKELFSLLNIDNLSKSELMSIHSYSEAYNSWKKDIYAYNDDWVVSDL